MVLLTVSVKESKAEGREVCVTLPLSLSVHPSLSLVFVCAGLICSLLISILTGGLPVALITDHPLCKQSTSVYVNVLCVCVCLCMCVCV